MAILARARIYEEIDIALHSAQTLKFQPFDPVSKRAEASISVDHTRYKVTKGAPQVVVSLFGDQGDLAARVEKVTYDFAAHGYRPLGVARTDGDKWIFVGMLALYDPPRHDSAKTIQTAEDMNIEVKMITGDHEAIAREIARRVGLGTNIEPAEDFARLPDSEALRMVREANGFARVFPEHKYRIVDLLQKAGYIVGMTGDGVNDAPALKKADAGIAVAGATDAAKQAADIVLTNPALSVIIDSIRQSRNVFERIRSYTIYRINETIRILLFIAIVILAFDIYPVTATMIVWLVLFNDTIMMSIAYDRVRRADQPEQWDIFNILSAATILGLIGVSLTFIIYFVGKRYLSLSPGELQTFIFLNLAVAGNISIFNTRTRGHIWANRPGNALLFASLGANLATTLIAVYGAFITPIGWRLAGIMWAYCIVAIFVTDFLKVRFYHFLKKTGFWGIEQRLKERAHRV